MEFGSEGDDRSLSVSFSFSDGTLRMELEAMVFAGQPRGLCVSVILASCCKSVICQNNKKRIKNVAVTIVALQEG